MASLQNSVPVQAIAPRQNGENLNLQLDLVQLADQLAHLIVRYIHDHDVLHDRGAQLSIAVLLRKVRQRNQLIAGKPSAQHRSAHGRKPGLPLRSHADVIAIDIIRDHILSQRRRIELVTNLLFNSRQHGFRRPAVPHEQILDARAGAVFTQLRLLAEDPNHRGDDLEGLILRNKRRNAHRHVRLGRKSAANTQRITDLFPTFDRGQRHVINLGVRAPQRAARNRNLELARQVVKLRIRCQGLRDFNRQRTRIQQLVMVYSRNRAAGDRCGRRRRRRPSATGPISVS